MSHTSHAAKGGKPMHDISRRPRALGRVTRRALAAVTLPSAVGIALPATPAAAAAPPLPSDVTFASTPVIDPSGLFMVSRGLNGDILYSPGNRSTNSYENFFSLGQQIIGDPTGVF